MGYFMRVLKVPEAPMVITFLLAPQAEENIRRGLLIQEGDWSAALFNSPLAIGLAIAVVFFTYLSTRLRMAERMEEITHEVEESDKA
jgi:putative tricarboxylic transport membrane protein